MQQAVFISMIAGVLSAGLYGVFTPGSLLLAPMMFIAPMPLMVAGLGWHPLLAALGGLFGCLVVSFVIGSKVALGFGLAVALPAWLTVLGVLALMRRLPAGAPALATGRVIGAYVLGGFAAYATATLLVGALSVNVSFDGFEQALSRTFERMLASMARQSPGLPLDADTIARMSGIFVSVFVPLWAGIIAAMLAFSLWLALRVLRRGERLPFTPPPAYAVSLPRESLIGFIGALILAQAPGYAGFVGAAAAAAIGVLFLLNGLAYLHWRTRGQAARPLMLGLAWLALLLFLPTALVFSFVGGLDAAFDFRRSGDPSNPQI